jgi:hypothetical protein
MKELTKRGFNYTVTVPNPRNPQLMCWDYEDTPEFEKAFSEITKRRKQRHG